MAEKMPSGNNKEAS